MSGDMGRTALPPPPPAGVAVTGVAGSAGGVWEGAGAHAGAGVAADFSSGVGMSLQTTAGKGLPFGAVLAGDCLQGETLPHSEVPMNSREQPYLCPKVYPRFRTG